jgi:hypothetical protein
VHAQAGLTSKLTTAEYKFGTQTVDFAYFAATETSAITLTTGAAAIALGLSAVALM